MRSFLFVPGDSQRKFENAKKTAADALILDLEDSIAPEEKIGARRTVREMLDARKPNQKIYVRVNALDTDMTLGDLAAVMPGRPDGIVLPKCAGAADVNRLSLYLDALREESIAARQDGFLAKAVIHPKHVDVVNAAFLPTDEEIAWSEKVVKAFNDNPSSGVVKIDGKMIDKPHLRAAVKILALVRP